MHNEQWHHLPLDKNDNDDQGPGDGVDYGGVNCHGLLSLLLYNPINEGSNDPIDNNQIDALPWRQIIFARRLKNYILYYTQAVRIISDCHS